MKIAYLLPTLGVSGGVHVVCQHANRLARRGHDVTLLSLDLTHSLDWFPGQQARVLPARAIPPDCDVLIATSWATAFYVARLPARRKAYFVQSDETRFHVPGDYLQHLTRLSYLMNFEFITEAKWIQQWLQQVFGKTAVLVPNGLDDEIFFRDEPLAPPAPQGRILLEGAIDIPYKGMAEAFSVVSDLGAEVWCVSSLGRPKKGWRCDRFFEQVPIEQMRRLYSSCDVLLKMSSVEGFFGPPLEMMACGGTAVVTKVTGYDEYIVDGENALVVDIGDVAGAREAVRRILGDRTLQSRLREGGKATAADWRWEPSIDRLEQALLQWASGSAETHPARASVNESIAYFYFLTVAVEGDESIDREEGSAAGSDLVPKISDALILCARLERSRLFHRFAALLGSAYRWLKKVRAGKAMRRPAG